jgi:hypothetical protein
MKVLTFSKTPVKRKLEISWKELYTERIQNGLDDTKMNTPSMGS